jgi:hypothetical protein
LELDGLTKRCGDVIALDGLPSPCPPGRCTASSARTEPADHRGRRVHGRGRRLAGDRFATIGALVPLAARLYAGSVLQLRTRVSVRRAWRAAATDRAG